MRWLSLGLRFLLGYKNLVSVFAGIVSWEFITHTTLTSQTRTSLYAGAFIAITFHNWYQASHRPAASSLQTSVPRTFIQNPEFILHRLNDPNLIRDMNVVPYLEKWVLVTARFEALADSLLRDAIHVSA